MSDQSGERLTAVILGTLKIFVGVFVLKVVLVAVGFTGYVPIADEVFNFVMKTIMMFNTGQGVIIPSHLK